MKTQNHWSDLIVWQEAHKLVLSIYTLLPSLPKEENYALADQIKRAAYSVPSNIVEGYSKNSDKDFARFLYISRGSLEELRYFLILSKDLGYISKEKYNKYKVQTEKVSKLLNGLIKAVKGRIGK